MRMHFLPLRRELIKTVQSYAASGLNPGKAGNASVRARGEDFLITPTGIPYDKLLPADIVMMDQQGNVPRAQRLPSSEWRIHADIYRSRPEAGAIAHVHSPYATALACAHRPLPAFHYMVAVAGGADIRCAPYATFGTQELSDNALDALTGRSACLLANHGLIALGDNLEGALALAVEVEFLARQYVLTLQIGEPQLLDAQEMRRVVKKFQTYGKQK